MRCLKRLSASNATKRRDIALTLQSRNLAVYAVGEGWTGALGTGILHQDVPGHDDEDELLDSQLEPMTTENVKSVATGWGHTAVINQRNELLLTGRPHDFSALLRLKRLPKIIRNYSVRQTLQSTRLDDASLKDEVSGINILNPTEALGNLVAWFSGLLTPDSKDWETARAQSILLRLTPVEVASDEKHEPASVVCSAGFSAFITGDGELYAFGLNGFGQCGTGSAANNVWHPTRVTGLSSEFAAIPRAEMEQTHPITQVALGLQHGICLNSEGEIFCWGKGERGQLGQPGELLESHTALPIKRRVVLAEGQVVSTDSKPVYQDTGKVVQIAAGMIHCAALTVDNKVLIWGKHVLPAFGEDIGKKIASDAMLPYVLNGLPPNLRVEQISCGSHHTSILLEDGSVWAVGVSSDTKEPIHEPTMIVPGGIVEMPVRQFAAHMDRTTIVGRSGRTVHQIHLWKDPELRDYALFSPAWIEQLLMQNEQMTIREIHRSWTHSVVVTDP